MELSINLLAVRADDAAKILNVSRSSLTRMMNAKKIPYIKCDRIVLFRLIDLENFLKPQTKIYSDSEVFDVVLNTLERMSANG
jgi:excisionase family DNA binding protein